MISKLLAEKFIEQVTEYTSYNVNIMDEDGVIIASRNSERVGQYHMQTILTIGLLQTLVR